MTLKRRVLIQSGWLVADLAETACGLLIFTWLCLYFGGCSMNMTGLEGEGGIKLRPDAGGGDASALGDTGTVDTSLPDGIPLRPLGSGCTANDQCTSNVCAKNTGDSSGMCCDHPNDACNSCVGGYRTPVSDGTKCGGGLCDGVPPFINQISCRSTNYVCNVGACIPVVVDCCAQAGRCTGVAEDSTQPSRCYSL